VASRDWAAVSSGLLGFLIPLAARPLPERAGPGVRPREGVRRGLRVVLWRMVGRRWRGCRRL